MLDTQELHPSEEDLERFLRNEISETELEVIEPHLLVCESCITKLEELQSDALAWKLALSEHRLERLEKEHAKQARWNWFAIPKWSWAAACAVLVAGIFVAPSLRPHQGAVTEATLTAYRGAETESLPLGHPIQLHLNALDLAEGPVRVGLFNETGDEMWTGQTQVLRSKADVALPAFSHSGSYFVRLFAEPSGGNPEGRLLREFAFSVR